MATSRKYDPRMGDEESNEPEPKETRFDEGPPPQKHVRMEAKPPVGKKKVPSVMEKILHFIPIDMKWIPENCSYSKLKPVFRSAVMGWVSIIFLIVPRVAQAMGQAAFLIVVVAFLDPPSDPFIAVLEREGIFLFLVCLAWAWSTFGIFLASLARTNTDVNAPFNEILTARYVEAGPTIIFAVFIFFGSSFFLWLRVRQGPGPFIFGTVFSCICVDISMTTAVLFPYAYYSIGRAIVVPLAIHSGLCVLAAATIFPATITARYMTCFGRVLEPLNVVLARHREILDMDPSSEDFKSTAATISTMVNKAEAALASAGAANRLLKRDIVWGRFAPGHLAELQWWLRRLVTRSNGMGVYFTLIDPTREKFPVTPVPSTPATPAIGTPAPSRPPSPTGERAGRPARRRLPNDQSQSSSPMRHSISQHVARHFSAGGHVRHHPSHHAHNLHYSLLHLAHNLSLSRVSTTASEQAVGVFESQRYLYLESTRLSAARSPEATALFTALLHESCDELLEKSQNALKGVQDWIGGVRQSSFGSRKKIEHVRKTKLEHLESLHQSLKEAVDHFKKEKRLRVLDPYRSAFDPKHIGTSDRFEEPPPHKFLFDCYVYEYHAMEFANLLAELLGEIIKLEKKCTRTKLWLPTLSLTKFLVWSRWDTTEDEHEDDEDPDVIRGLNPEESADLGIPQRRNPDALPPSNIVEQIFSWLYLCFSTLLSGNTLFALKAGVLSILLSLPSLLRNTAEFAYGQRFVWAIFMGQLTLARWRGDTTFGLVSRILSTILGSAVGLAVWYLSAGSSDSNPYGLAAVCAVCFPLFYFIRLYWPGPPMANVIFFVTVGLVVGYSWQNTHFPFGFHYFGWDLAWRRFLTVVAGVTAAFIFSFLPPSHTLRGYHRHMMATTVAELGSAYCAIVSFANTHRQQQHEVDRDSIIKSLIGIRLKLKRSLILKTNIVYEFSLRGKWPAERYQKILEIQLQIAYLLSHLMSVVEHLEPAWARAFLRRTRFLDSDFQGDVLAVISLISTSLRTGNPLPQITPCPLLDRFMAYTHGLNVIRQEADDDYGLPRTMTIDTLENEQYLRFSVGVNTAFGIVMRLDRLMVATKELVGEQYHIHGVGLSPLKTYRDQSGSIRPAKDA